MKFYKIILIYIIGTFTYAQNNDIKFERLGTKNGLTQNNITSITQDELGYIWIATENGLNRYDGYNFRAYLYDPDNDNSPHGNWINYLLSDSHGKLWMFLGAGGIDCFDTKTEKFERYTSDEKDSSGLPEKFLNFPYLDKWDNLWLGTFNSGLLKFDRNNRNFIKIANNPADEFSISSNRTLCAFADSLSGNKYLWIGAGNMGFNQLNIETGEIIRIQWRDIKPGKKLYDFVKSKISNNKNIASIIKTGDKKKISKSFSLNKKTKILIVCEGEAIPVSNIDYGKIFKNNKMIWQSDQNKSAFAGGENRNRIQFDILELDKGSYDLYFETDSLHSYDKWYNNAPDYPEYWGIQIFEIDDKEIAEINYDIKKIENTTSINSTRITAFERVDDNLWIAAWGVGLNKMNLKTREFTNYKMSDEKNKGRKNFIIDLKKDSKGRLWALNQNLHISCFDTRTGNFININSGEIDFENIVVTRSFEDKEGNIWIGTLRDGLFQIKFDNSHLPTVTNYKYDPFDAHSISSNTINSIMQDNSGNIWVGTSGGGINKFNTRKPKFNLVNNNKDTSPHLIGRKVTSFAEDNSGNVWIGTADEGLYKFNIKENKIESINNDGGKYKNISALYFDGKENLYIGLYYKGVYKYNLSKKTFSEIDFKNHSNTIRQNAVSVITGDKDNNIWVGLFSYGCFRINEETEKLDYFTQDPNSPSSLPATAVWTIYIDKKNDVWIGTAAGGLSKLIKGSNNFINYSDEGSDPDRFRNATVGSIYEDSEGNFWIGSFSAGINLMNRETGKFKFYMIKHGLPGNRINGILEDSKKNLWLSTNNGISKFDPANKTFKNYDYTDGLQDNEFTRGAYLKTKSGKMFFGGDHGFNYFNPDEIKDNEYIPQINISAFKKYGEEIKFDKSLETLEQIELGYNEVQISFEFVSLDYTFPAKNKYAYKMEGFDNDWVYSGKRRYANYTNLFPGEYVFKVIGSNSDGVWNTEGASIKIIVYPPFWNTWWFYLITAVFLFSLVFSIYRYAVWKKINKMMEHEKIRNRERENVREELSRDFHDELGHKLTRISMYARNLIKKNTAGSSELIDELEKVNETSQSLHLGAKDLIWSLNPGEDTLYDTVIRLKDFGDDLFDKTVIKFGAKGINESYKSIKLPMEWKRHLTLIFKESMNNILKYAECENVLFQIIIENKILKIELSDDGKGFELNSDSNGYGLSNIKKRAENILGKINIVSNKEEGTHIIFTSDISHLYD